jgi:hypothetical protein
MFIVPHAVKNRKSAAKAEAVGGDGMGGDRCSIAKRWIAAPKFRSI